MTMSVSLVKVGNSNAVIIPAKVLKQMNIKEGAKFELTIEGSSTIQIKKLSTGEKPAFPKVTMPEISTKEIKSFIDGLAVVDMNDFEGDERAEYILGR